MVLSPAVLMATRNARLQRIGGGGAAAFSPQSVPGFIGWHTTSNPDSVATQLGNVVEFADTYGAGPSLIQANIGQQPPFSAANADAGGNAAVVSSSLKGLNWDTPIPIKFVMFAHQSNATTGLTFILVGDNNVGPTSAAPYLGQPSSDVIVRRNGELTPVDPTIPSHVFLPITNYAISSIAMPNYTSTSDHFMWNGYNRNLSGPYTDVMPFSEIPSEENQAKLLTFLNNVVGL